MPHVPDNYRPLTGSERDRPRGAIRGAGADPAEQITVTVRLRRRPGAPPLPGTAELTERLASGAPPLVTREEFAARYGAGPADVAQLRGFAVSQGLAVGEVSPARRTVQLSGTAAQLSRAFAVDLYRYEGPHGSYRGREGAIYLPAGLTGLVEGVFGLDDRRMATPANARLTGAAAIPAGVRALTPPEVAQLYGFPDGWATGQTIGLIEFGGGYRPADIVAFYAAVDQPQPDVVSIGVDGAANAPSGDPDADGEVALDIDVAGSVAPGARLAVYFAPWTEQGWLDVITTAVHDTTNQPCALSISWGWPEHEKAGGLSWTRAVMKAVGETFAEAAALGVTVLAASGDSGSGCGVGDGVAHVLYPASDPNVLACGGTRISAVKGSSFTETTWANSNGSTGGGVSAAVPLPDWQEKAGVPTSVNDGRPGRGLPDVAGNADPASGYPIVVQGVTQQTGGTSAVAPLYAGLAALLTALRGQPAGFLNPALYQLAGTAAVRDVADGASNATGGSPGYQSGPGWDACTGLGSINGDSLLAALTAAPGSGGTAPGA